MKYLMARKFTIKKTKNKAQYKRKILNAYLLIIIIYTVIVIFLHSGQELNKFKLQMDMTNSVYFSKVTDDIDYKINSMFNIVKGLTTDEYVKQYSHENKNYYAITKVCQKLGDELDVFINLNSKIYLNKIGDDLVLMPNQTTTLEQVFEESDLNTEEFAQIQTHFLKQKPWEKNEPVYIKSNDKLIYIFKPKINIKNNILCFFVFDRNDILPFLSGELQEVFAIYNDGELLSYNSNEMIDEREFIELENKSSKQFFRYEKKSNTELGWDYVYYVSKNHEIISPIFILGYIIISAFGIFLALIWSRITYKPIKSTIYSIKDNSEFEIVGNEFELITSEVKQIRHEKKSLEQKILASKQIIRKRIINRILHGLFTEEEYEELDINLNVKKEEPCLVIVLQLKKLVNDDSRLINIHHIYNDLNRILTENNLSNVMESIQINANRIGLIINDKNKDEISNLLKNIIISIEEQYGMNIIASFGSEVTSIFKLEQSYKVAIKILEYQFAFNKMIITEEDISGFDDSFYYPLEHEQNLINLSLAGKQEEVLDVIDHLLEENLRLRSLSADVLSQFIFAIAGTLNRVISKVSGIDESFKEEIKYTYLELKMCNTKDQLDSKIKEVFRQTLKLIKKNNFIEEFKHIDSIINFINTNFHKDLSLTDVAENFNLSAGYVGIIFKKSQGINFKDYVNTLKVKKAKEIMKSNTQIKIKDLANELGYNSTNTFIRIFKKYEGISPGAYKDALE